MDPEVFVSYRNSADHPLASALCSALRGMGVPVWFDQAQQLAGDPLARGVQTGVRSATMAVVLLSGSSESALRPGATNFAGEVYSISRAMRRNLDVAVVYLNEQAMLSFPHSPTAWSLGLDDIIYVLWFSPEASQLGPTGLAVELIRASSMRGRVTVYPRRRAVRETGYLLSNVAASNLSIVNQSSMRDPYQDAERSFVSLRWARPVPPLVRAPNVPPFWAEVHSTLNETERDEWWAVSFGFADDDNEGEWRALDLSGYRTVAIEARSLENSSRYRDVGFHLVDNNYPSEAPDGGSGHSSTGVQYLRRLTPGWRWYYFPLGDMDWSMQGSRGNGAPPDRSNILQLTFLSSKDEHARYSLEFGIRRIDLLV